MIEVTEKRRKAVVVGGGITGLTAAFYLQKEARENNLPVDVVLIEASIRVGGKIETVRKDGFIIERGPESFLDTANSIRSLARELNMEQELIQHNNGQTYITVGSEFHAIPNGFMFGGPSEVTSLVTSSLISLSGKIRAAGDLFIRQSNEKNDESIADFFRRRFGNEIVENLVDPLLAGTFAGDIDHLSMHAMFPQFYDLEKKHRSLIKGYMKSSNGFYSLRQKNGQTYYETFRNGLSTLIERLEAALIPGTIMKGVKVDWIEKTRDNQLNVFLDDAPPILADRVIVATPFNVAKKIFRDYASLQNMQPMNNATIATVTMAFKSEDIKKYKNALNIFVSRNSSFAITSCTFASNKWDNVAPVGHELLRIYIGRVGDETIVELSDKEIEKTVMHDLELMLGITVPPIFTVVARWQQGMPQYTVGHEQRMQQLYETFGHEFEQVQLIGSSYEGISMPQCVEQGRVAAMHIVDQWK